MKRIQLGQTFDDTDCVQSGYVFTLGKDREGYYRLYAEYRTRWQGNITGIEYRDPEQYETIEEAKEASEVLFKRFEDIEDLPGNDIEANWEETKPGVMVR